MSCVYEGLQLPFDSALRVETRYFVSLLRDPVAKSMIRTLFFGLQEANKLARRPKGVPKQEYKKIGILGAGLMGAGIASVSVAGRARDRAGRPRPGRGRQGQGAYRGRARQAGQARPHDPGEARRRCWRASRATPDFGALKGCELVIEAVFENREVKAEATKKAEAALGADAVFASNTSTLPITGLAEASARPRELHRPALLLAGREDAAGRDHRRQEDLARDARAGDGLRAEDPQDADRRQRQPRLLHLPRLRRLHQRRPSPAEGGRAGRHDRELRALSPACRWARWR